MNDHKEIVREWASEIREIERVWIIGSRARGDHRPDSDLDVWVEAWPGWWIFEHENWRDDLQHRLETVQVHLVEYQGEDSALSEMAGHEPVLIYSEDNP